MAAAVLDEDGGVYGSVGLEKETGLACLKPMGAQGGSEEWREISQLAFKGLTLAAARVLDDQSCFGRCYILMTSSFLAILSGSQGDLSKCTPDTQLKAPQQRRAVWLGGEHRAFSQAEAD